MTDLAPGYVKVQTNLIYEDQAKFPAGLAHLPLWSKALIILPVLIK